MASYTHVFADEETKNWFKAFIALQITKEGLTEFVDKETQKIHSIVGKGCGNCFIENLLKCPTRDICSNQHNCNFHNAPGKQNRTCPVNVCDQIRINIILQHRFSRPSWKNTDATKWNTHVWEIAKCFLHPDGYLQVTSVQNTDFNGMINIILNCIYFDTSFSFNISPKHPQLPCILTKARQIGRDVRHTADCKVTDVVLQDYFLTLTTLLTDSKCLSQHRSASQAVTKLLKLQTDRLAITQTELSILLHDAHQTLDQCKQVRIQAGMHICQELLKALDQMKSYTNESLITLDEHTQRILQRITDAETHAIKRIQQTGKQCMDDNYQYQEQEFLNHLVQHYKDNLSNIPLSHLVKGIDRDDFYVTPEIVVLYKEKDTRITTYEQLFYSEQGLNRKIFIQGEPGVGKSTLAINVVLDWVNQISVSPKNKKTTLEHEETLKHFDFIFFVSMCNSANERELVKMIK
ncbi:hypothetical protein DPMN_166409 [Dreissena polymorpha]|uniref:NACHT domain-containing protein n=1 Tax=Dreissena polymorpha TaxID=45954 RepID=A0A9D4EWT9_DREPO|nr:hypothetical protein DPMN_166409 [Dreissena polymorpha]